MSVAVARYAVCTCITAVSACSGHAGLKGSCTKAAFHVPPARPLHSRFNLLREESEGYAKLATLVNQQASGRLTDATAPAVVSTAAHAACRACRTGEASTCPAASTRGQRWCLGCSSCTRVC